MASIEFKSIDRIRQGDRLLVDAGVFSKAGREIDEKTIQLFAKHKVSYVPTISLTYEEQEKFKDGRDGAVIEDFIGREIRKRRPPFDRLRLRLLDKLKSIYIPFYESHGIFQAKGKKKQLTRDKLLEGNLPSLYQPDTDAGSESLLSPNKVDFLIEIIKAFSKQLENLSYLGPETRRLKKRLNRINLNSVRLHSLFSGERLTNVGDAVAWHVADTGIYFFYAITNLNKKRILSGCPLTVARFDPDQAVDEKTEFQYYPGTLCDAFLGILLHRIGDLHESIHPVLSAKAVLDPDDPVGRNKIRLLQRSDYVTRNLLRNRRDISSIARMICLMQHEYPDGTGFPPLNTNKYLHELVRLFQIVDFYDEMTNPIILKSPFSRFEVIEYMKTSSGEYRYVPGSFVPNARFDRMLLEEFLQILAPYEIGEKVYLYAGGKRNEHYFVGRVFSYLDSHIPLISILVDERSNKKYRYGDLLFNIPGGDAYFVKNGKIVRNIKMDWIKELQIYDLSMNPGGISEYGDSLFGKQRVLSRKLKKVI